VTLTPSLTTLHWKIPALLENWYAESLITSNNSRTILRVAQSPPSSGIGDIARLSNLPAEFSTGMVMAEFMFCMSHVVNENWSAVT